MASKVGFHHLKRAAQLIRVFDRPWGKRALRAALNPAPVPYLFMVARGDGTHTFSTNLADHLLAKARLDSIRVVLASSQKAAKDSLLQN